MSSSRENFRFASPRGLESAGGWARPSPVLVADLGSRVAPPGKARRLLACFTLSHGILGATPRRRFIVVTVP